MSDYKRFVAYLYEYHEQSKGENRGFVRVEARNGTCQMAFQLKVFSLPEGSVLNVYGFVRIRDYLFGIPAGILRAGRSGISGRLMMPSVHMGDSAFSLSDLGGLILFGPEGRIYATQWDDIAIRPERFTTDTSILQVSAPDEEEALPDDSTSFPEQETGSGPAAETSTKPADASESQAAAAPQPITNPELQADSAPELRAASAPARSSSTEGSPALSSSGRWHALQESCPHMHPFDDDEISECIRLDLKDLPRLRKQGWQVGSSQFLLHGFHNYRHLLMGRLSDGNTDTFIFGVPGIFDVKEQFMAGMFGFSCFKPARPSQTSSDITPFGYWYRPVQ